MKQRKEVAKRRHNQQQLSLDMYKRNDSLSIQDNDVSQTLTATSKDTSLDGFIERDVRRKKKPNLSYSFFKNKINLNKHIKVDDFQDSVNFSFFFYFFQIEITIIFLLFRKIIKNQKIIILIDL